MGTLNKGHRILCVTEQNRSNTGTLMWPLVHRLMETKSRASDWSFVSLAQTIAAFKAFDETRRLLLGIKESHQPHSPPVEILTV